MPKGSNWLRVTEEDRVLAELEADKRTLDIGLTNSQLSERTGMSGGQVSGVLGRLRTKGKVNSEEDSSLEGTNHRTRFWFIK